MLELGARVGVVGAPAPAGRVLLHRRLGALSPHVPGARRHVNQENVHRLLPDLGGDAGLVPEQTADMLFILPYEA